jgi:hypothetical protein
MGDYVAIQNNALPTTTMIGVTVVSQRDSSEQYGIKPFADQGVTMSFMPSKVTVDVANRRIYVADSHGGTAALDFLPREGLTRAWVQPYRTGSFLTLCGPARRRVLVMSDIGNGPYDSLGAPRHMTETLRWIDAENGETLSSIGGLIRNFGLTLSPGPFGAIYYAAGSRGLYRLRPGPRLGENTS